MKGVEHTATMDQYLHEAGAGKDGPKAAILLCTTPNFNWVTEKDPSGYIWQT